MFHVVLGESQAGSQANMVSTSCAWGRTGLNTAGENRNTEANRLWLISWPLVNED